MELKSSSQASIVPLQEWGQGLLVGRSMEALLNGSGVSIMNLKLIQTWSVKDQLLKRWSFPKILITTGLKI